MTRAAIAPAEIVTESTAAVLASVRPRCARADDWLAELDLDAIRAAVALTPEATEAAA